MPPFVPPNQYSVEPLITAAPKPFTVGMVPPDEALAQLTPEKGYLRYWNRFVAEAVGLPWNA